MKEKGESKAFWGIAIVLVISLIGGLVVFYNTGEKGVSPAVEVIFDENISYDEYDSYLDRSIDFSSGDVIRWKIDSYQANPIDVMFFKETPWQLLFERENCVKESGEYTIHADGEYVFRLWADISDMPHEPFEVRLRVSRIA